MLATNAADQASCVAPFLRADQRAQPPEPDHATSLGVVARGTSVTVYGRWYYSGPCQDKGPTAGARPPAATVSLVLKTSDGHAVTMTSATPKGPDASFAATVTIPAGAAPGKAKISDGRGNYVSVVVAGE